PIEWARDELQTPLGTAASVRAMTAGESRGTVLLLGTLDTKGEEYAFVRDLLQARGLDVLVVDVGVLGEPAFAPDISRHDVAAAGGADLDSLAGAGDRGQAMLTMTEG